MKKFALIGLAGYIAPRHLQAIRDTGNELIAAMDINDSVGVVDSYFPNAAFFREYERFDRHLEKLRRAGIKLDYLTICSPNYLHDAHIRFGLRHGADVICEKPLVLNPWNLDSLRTIENETGNRVNAIMQLRLHPDITALQEKYTKGDPSEKAKVSLTYITSRGNWYYASWKGDPNRSGGIATNIGIHFFDMLRWIFGEVEENEVHIHTHDRASGRLVLERAEVSWFLSINEDTLPDEIKDRGQRTFRHIAIDGAEVEFSVGFNELHTRSYEKILSGEGFTIADALPAISIVHDIRSSRPIGLTSKSHKLAHLPLSPHPFDTSRQKLNQ